MLAGVVAEGRRDFPIFKEVLQKICPSIEEVRLLHPPSDGLRGDRRSEIKTTGWTGVRHWCARYGPELTRFMREYGDPLDLLVIAMDASVAHNPAIALEKPCPPASDTTEALRDQVTQWLGGSPPDAVVIVIPSMTPDAWVCAALIGENGLLECDPDPLARLAKASLGRAELGFKLKRGAGGDVKKPTARQYSLHLAPKVAARFEQVQRLCGEAHRFAQEVQERCHQEEESC